MTNVNQYISFLTQEYNKLYQWSQPSNPWDIPSEIGKTGFWMSTYVCAIGAPIVFFIILLAVWNLAQVGIVRKSLSTIFICALFPIIYPALIISLNLVVWTVASIIIAFGAVILLPLFVLGWIHWGICDAVMRHIKRQSTIVNDEVDDITIGELILAVLVFTLSLPTTGILTLVLTVLKSPLVIISIVLSYSFYTLKNITQFVIKSGNDDGCAFYFVSLWLYPLFMLGFCICVPIVTAMVLLSILIKFVISGVWPAYVASGWVRSLRSRRREPAMKNPLKALNHARIAAYQVIWFSDAVTNLTMKGKSAFDRNLYKQFETETTELVKGNREEFSEEIKQLSILPPPTMIGILKDRNNWQHDMQSLARGLKMQRIHLEHIWKFFFAHCCSIGNENIEKELLTNYYIMEMPPAVTIGLSQLVVLACIVRTVEHEKSEGGQSTFVNNFVLEMDGFSTGREVTALETSRLNTSSSLGMFLLTETNRPRGQPFVDDLWQKMLQIKKLYHEYLRILIKDERNKKGKKKVNPTREMEIFEAIILSAGESFDYLPMGFQNFFKDNGITENMDFDTEFFSKAERLQKLKKIRNLLSDIGLKIAKNQKFKTLMMNDVVNPLMQVE